MSQGPKKTDINEVTTPGIASFGEGESSPARLFRVMPDIPITGTALPLRAALYLVHWTGSTLPMRAVRYLWELACQRMRWSGHMRCHRYP
jgi:hypothetical protein